MIQQEYLVLYISSQQESHDAFVEDFRESGKDWRTIHVKSVDEAIEQVKINHQSIVLIFCEMELGSKSAIDLRRVLGIDYAYLPFIVITDEISNELIEVGHGVKVTHFVHPPLSRAKIMESVEKYGEQQVFSISDRDILKGTFIAESFEFLDDLESLVFELKENPSQIGTINSIFRIIHTIKGSASVLQQPNLTHYLHAFEDFLSKLRNCTILVTAQVIVILLRSIDNLGKLISSLRDGKLQKCHVHEWIKDFDMSILAEKHVDVEDSVSQNVLLRRSETSSVSYQRTTRVSHYLLDKFAASSERISDLSYELNELGRCIHGESSDKSMDSVSKLLELLKELQALSFDIQEKIVDLRKVPLKTIYRSFPRVIHDLSQQLRKEVSLILQGDELLVNQNTARVLSFTLIHILRNSIDHGIELPDMRIKAGKSRKGMIKVVAENVESQLKLVISDDGYGLDAEKIGQSAVNKGTIKPEKLQEMSHSDIYNLVFESGFSTSHSITAISGRGVGLDMVKSSVESIGGTIKISSTLGQGSEFIIMLPS